MKKFFTIFLCIFLFAGCNEKEKEYLEKLQRLEDREKRLNEREIEMAVKLADYDLLKSKFDSISTAESDSLKMHSQNVLGEWSSSMVCTSSSCTGFAIGDVRTGNWKFSKKEDRIEAESYDAKGKLIRTYYGNFQNNDLFLRSVPDTDSLSRNTMELVINDIQSRRMRGYRKISQQNCEVFFSIDLNRVNP
ncbi:MAG: hypothetical protein Q4G27_06200 [Flavobacteriaceae bacterium]|nr:hypothetical protein [Flavobacteriaceae bacterium]